MTRITRLVFFGYIGALFFAAAYDSLLGGFVATLGGGCVVMAELRR